MDMEEAVVLLDVECVAVGIEQCQATAVAQSVCFCINFIAAKLYIFFNKLYLDILPFARKFLSFVK